MDENYAERAAEVSTAMVAEGIRRVRQQKPPPEGFAGDCECGEPVLPRRVELGFYNCVDCQAALERRRKLFRK